MRLTIILTLFLAVALCFSSGIEIYSYYYLTHPHSTRCEMNAISFVFYFTKEMWIFVYTKKNGKASQKNKHFQTIKHSFIWKQTENQQNDNVVVAYLSKCDEFA